ncbi:MAG: CocE/NonD family hydrolase, partial [Alphaproteobacteria bacterium]|nr:CocE/NonD family hydrolase [Alphaproteobacteria bacterium]
GRLEHGGRWRSTAKWPLPQTHWARLYLRDDRSLSGAPATMGSRALEYAFDPRDPVPTRGGAISSGEPVMYAGAFDQSAAASRPDVLVFATPPLDQELEVVGPVTVRLWIASDAPDTDFTAKLIDVYPPGGDLPHGFAMNLTEGLLRARYRDSWERPTLMVPGEVYPIAIELFPIANLFCRGHRLRLDISSSNFPHFDVNPNSGEPEGAWQQPRIARNRVFIEATRPSHILLPVIPRDAMNRTDREQS